MVMYLFHDRTGVSSKLLPFPTQCPCSLSVLIKKTAHLFDFAILILCLSQFFLEQSNFAEMHLKIFNVVYNRIRIYSRIQIYATTREAQKSSIYPHSTVSIA